MRRHNWDVRVEPLRRESSRRRNGWCRLGVRRDREAALVLRALRARGLRPDAPGRARRGARRRSLQRTSSRRVEQGRGRRTRSRDERRRRPERGRPALQRPDLRRVLRGGRDLPRHGDDALRAASDEPVRGGRGQARRLPVRACRALGRRRACSRSSGSASSPAPPTCSPATRPTSSSRRSTRSGSATARTSSSKATTSRPPSPSGRRSRSA